MKKAVITIGLLAAALVASAQERKYNVKNEVGTQAEATVVIGYHPNQSDLLVTIDGKTIEYNLLSRTTETVFELAKRKSMFRLENVETGEVVFFIKGFGDDFSISKGDTITKFSN